METRTSISSLKTSFAFRHFVRTTGEVLYQGIAARTFERSFQLADYVKVKGASLENGLLHVDLVREIPQAMRPRSIPIANSSKLLEPIKVAA
jgi:molecular chaperone IbpA